MMAFHSISLSHAGSFSRQYVMYDIGLQGGPIAAIRPSSLLCVCLSRSLSLHFSLFLSFSFSFSFLFSLM